LRQRYRLDSHPERTTPRIRTTFRHVISASARCRASTARRTSSRSFWA